MWASELDEAARWEDLVAGLRLMPYQAKGVPDRFVSVGPATTAKASSEGWRLCLRPNKVHVLLYEFQLNTNENFMLPKSCMLILLRRKDKTYQGRISKKSYVRVSPALQNRPEETVISFYSQKL
jgi:hypothetical protein